MKTVVIVGGGFAGLLCAKRLAKSEYRVVVVDRRNHHLFQPLLYQVATAGLSPADIAVPIRGILRRQKNVSVVLDEVVDVDTENQRVMLAESPAISYDNLVLATGAGHSYFGHSDWAELAPGLKTVEDAIEMRRRILSAFEKAETAWTEEEEREWLTFAIVGGGPTGVELAGAIAELADRALARDFDRIHPESARIVLLQGGSRILEAFPENLSEKAKRDLESMGVEIRLDAYVTEISQDGVFVGDEKIPARTVLWAAGVKASPAAEWLGVEPGPAGKVRVQPDLTVLPNIYVVGDAAHLEQDGRPLPGVAQVAMQGGVYVADHIMGKKSKPFRYWDKGNLATIGRKRAVAEIGKRTFSGFIAWALWLFIHIAYLIGFRNKAVVIFQWSLSYLTYQKGARLITDRWRPQ